MNKKLVNIGKKDRSCLYCEYGRLSPNGVSVLCVRKGIMAADAGCRKFRYDPLKREPEIAPQVERANAENFKF